MDFFSNALGAIPAAASHPFALLAYVAVLLAWLVIGLRVKRNSNLINGLHHLPEGDRIIALKAEMRHVDVPAGLSATDWLERNRQQYYLIAFLAVLGALVVVVVIAMVQVSNVERSSSELIKVLDRREAALQSSFHALLAPAIASGEEPGVPTFAGETDRLALEREFREKLQKIREETNSLLRERRAALEDGELVLAHELGNELNQIGTRVAGLVDISTDRLKALEEMVEIFSMMCPTCMLNAMALEKAEEQKLANLVGLHDAYINLPAGN